MSDRLEVFAAELTDWSFLTTVEELLAILTAFLPHEVECKSVLRPNNFEI
jgi:hypothetical protein